MGHETFPLETIRVASPCTVSWDSMQGDERVRFCGECNLHVYNLSGMAREAAEALVSRSEGRLCVRLLRRHDGTVLTQDCPVGLRALRLRVVRGLAAAASVLFALLFGTPKAAGAPAPLPKKAKPTQVAVPTFCPPTVGHREVEILGKLVINPARQPIPLPPPVPQK